MQIGIKFWFLPCIPSISVESVIVFSKKNDFLIMFSCSMKIFKENKINQKLTYF